MNDPLWKFSTEDKSIDIVIGFIFLSALWTSIRFVWQNHLTIHARIMYGFIISISFLHLFQVTFQTITGGPAPFRVWDFINYLTGMLLLMIVYRLKHREKLD